jgi:hypothetical protein
MNERKYIDLEELSCHLSKLVKDVEATDGRFEILTRSRLTQSSTFPSEIVTGRFGSNHTVTLLCKYCAGIDHNSYGHRGGIEYEARIYQDVIRHLQLSTVRYYGCFNLSESNEICMVLEYLTDSKRLKDSYVHEGKVKAAAWIANLHTLCENKALPAVKVYDKNYYCQWVTIALDKNPDFKSHFPWITEVSNYFLEEIDHLTKAPQTLIHGEYYSVNILIRDDIIYPIDWESAAIGPGEIDLATLIDRKEEGLVRAIIEGYTTARWENGNFPSEEFWRKLVLAQMYINFRWIVEYSKPGIWIKYPRRLNHLYELAYQAGFA